VIKLGRELNRQKVISQQDKEAAVNDIRCLHQDNMLLQSKANNCKQQNKTLHASLNRSYGNGMQLEVQYNNRCKHIQELCAQVSKLDKQLKDLIMKSQQNKNIAVGSGLQCLQQDCVNLQINAEDLEQQNSLLQVSVEGSYEQTVEMENKLIKLIMIC